MRFKIRYRPSHIERSTHGYPMCDTDASSNIWFRYHTGRYWSLDKYDGRIALTILRVQKPEMRKGE